MKLRRVLRAQSEYQRRLVAEPDARALAAAASARLRQLVEDVRATWAGESRGTDVAALHAYVRRTLVAMQAAATAMGRPGADVTRLGAEFREAGVPLVLCLRGLDDSDLPVIAELAGTPLARSA